jgi:hypothetical protein
MGNYFDDVTLTLTAPTGTGTAADVSCDVTAATLTPDTPEEVRKRLCGQRTVTGKTTWTLELTWDQNWAVGAAGPPVVDPGLSKFLLDHDGELADFTLTWPLEATEATGTLRCKPGAFGGTAGEIAEATLTLGLDGEPSFGPIGATTTTTAAGDQADDQADTGADAEADDVSYAEAV